MSSRIGPNGEIVIPREIQDELSVVPGEFVEFERKGGDVVLRRAEPPQPLFGRYAGTDLAALLSAERAADRQTSDPELLVTDAPWRWRNLR